VTAKPKKLGRPKLGDRVVGVSPHKHGKWRVKYVQGGKERTRYYGSEETATEAAAQLQLQLLGPPAASGLTVDDAAAEKRQDWNESLEFFRDKIRQEPGNPVWQDAMKSTATGASAAAKLIDAESRLRRIEALEREMDKHRKVAGHAKRRQRGPAAR
jgi:hypothetical protein